MTWRGVRIRIAVANRTGAVIDVCVRGVIHARAWIRALVTDGAPVATTVMWTVVEPMATTAAATVARRATMATTVAATVARGATIIAAAAILFAAAVRTAAAAAVRPVGIATATAVRPVGRATTAAVRPVGIATAAAVRPVGGATVKTKIAGAVVTR